jgi:hypothetical protein
MGTFSAGYPTTFTGTLVGDNVQTTGGSVDSIPRPTKVGGVAISAVVELQSTTRGFVIPRMTTTQKNAIVTPVAGMRVFDTTLQADSFYVNGAWQAISALYGDQIVSVTLTQGQVQGMSATPQQILAAPGAGLSYYVNSCVLINNFNTSAFAGGGVVVLQYANTALGAGLNALSTTFAATVVTGAATRWASLAAPNAGTSITATANLGLFLSNQTGAFTGGNAASTLVCIVQYQVIPANA